MSINTVLVHTQYEENYGFANNTIHWKKKGGHTFQIKMDADTLMYTDPVAVFTEMLEDHCSNLERFTYVDHEIQWQEPTVLGTEEDYIAVHRSICLSNAVAKLGECS
jgi:hypothetical protein